MCSLFQKGAVVKYLVALKGLPVLYHSAIFHYENKPIQIY